MGEEAKAVALDPAAAGDAVVAHRDDGHAAERLSANCFFNALLRESETAAWVERGQASPPAGVRLPAVCVTLPAGDARLWLNVAYRSDCGRHQFALPVLRQHANGAAEPLSLAEAVQAIAHEPAVFPRTDARQRRQFIERTLASIRNMGQAAEARHADLPRLFGQPLAFAEAEQALLSGHSVHPTPKSREPLTDADARVYAPEFGNAFALEWLAVAPEYLQGDSGDDADAHAFARELWAADGAEDPPPAGYLPLPAHPWQWQRLQAHPKITRLLEDGALIPLGPSARGAQWRATSSLRAVHAGHSPYMLKFSLSLRLTNSLRTLQPAEMARGLEVPRIRATPVGRELAARYPDFHILAEPAYLLLADHQGAPIPESLALFRENPFQGKAADNVCLLATLTQDHPDGGPARAAELIRRHARRRGLSEAAACREWLDRFFDVVVEPLLVAQADYGLLFGAHQQNVILAFEDELPAAGYFRDCQGSGYSRLGVSLLAPYLPDLGADTENVIDDVMANRLFAYYLIVNSCFGLFGALGAAGVAAEADLLAQLHERLLRLRAGPRRDTSCLDYLLEAEQLWAKGNFHCAIVGLNETTTEDPLALYHPLANPLCDLTRNRT